IGWKFSEAGKPGEFGVVIKDAKDDPDEVAFHEDYTRFVVEGSLVPADAETAKLCGVPFELAKSEKKGT
ncbi:hypothetical protein OEK97_28880, partial [Escherichia coli]|uniref:hypothetical protein n=1 Tax=Escherichia coli TaxID=562 RepID=UPI0021DB0988